MASGIEVAQAYVTIIPSMKGIQNDIADAMDADRVGTDAGHKIGEGISAGISAKSVVIGNMVSDALRAAAGKAIDAGKDLANGVYTGYAQNEQLVSGMQKLFGDVDYQTVVDNANKAFMTAGMSANDYMNNVTGIASALVKSTGGDTAAAAELANQAMIDMSDNVNTFGSDADMVQNAIMGLAKGQFSMLDNLNLGFAGNQQGMLDLINASGVLDEALTDTSQLADVGFDKMLEAIHAVQEEAKITGSTQDEAMHTLEGSANAAKGAWDNVLTAIGTGDSSQVEAAGAGLIDTLFGTIDTETGAREGGLIENLTGLATRAFTALGASLPGLLDMALSALPPEIGGPLKQAFESIGKVVETVAPVVSAAIGGLVTAIGTIAPVVAPLLPIIAGALAAVKIVGVVTAIAGAISGFIGMASTAIGMISGIPALVSAIVTVLGGPVTIIAAIVGAIIAFIATNEDARNKVLEIWNAIKAAVSNAVSGAIAFITAAWTAASTTVAGVMNGIKSTISNVWNAVKSTVASVVGGIVTTISSKLSSVGGRVKSIFNTVKNNIMTPINAARNAVNDGMNRIKSIISGCRLQLPHISLPHFSVSGGKAPFGIGGKGSLPHFSVSWYARGGYFDQPTLFAGVGERGGEFVWPSYAPYLDRYADALSERMGGAGDVNVYLTYNGSGDASELVNTLTRDLRMMRMTGAI